MLVSSHQSQPCPRSGESYHKARPSVLAQLLMLAAVNSVSASPLYRIESDSDTLKASCMDAHSGLDVLHVGGASESHGGFIAQFNTSRYLSQTRISDSNWFIYTPEPVTDIASHSEFLVTSAGNTVSAFDLSGHSAWQLSASDNDTMTRQFGAVVALESGNTAVLGYQLSSWQSERSAVASIVAPDGSVICNTEAHNSTDTFAYQAYDEYFSDAVEITLNEQPKLFIVGDFINSNENGFESASGGIDHFFQNSILSLVVIMNTDTCFIEGSASFDSGTDNYKTIATNVTATNTEPTDIVISGYTQHFYTDFEQAPFMLRLNLNDAENIVSGQRPTDYCAVELASDSQSNPVGALSVYNHKFYGPVAVLGGKKTLSSAVFYTVSVGDCESLFSWQLNVPDNAQVYSLATLNNSVVWAGANDEFSLLGSLAADAVQTSPYPESLCNPQFNGHQLFGLTPTALDLSWHVNPIVNHKADYSLDRADLQFNAGPGVALSKECVVSMEPGAYEYADYYTPISTEQSNSIDDEFLHSALFVSVVAGASILLTASLTCIAIVVRARLRLRVDNQHNQRLPTMHRIV